MPSEHVESIVRKVESVTTVVGGGGPRFWFSVAPEQQQQNYAQVSIQLSDKEATPGVIARLQSTLSKEVAGALRARRSLGLSHKYSATGIGRKSWSRT